MTASTGDHHLSNPTLLSEIVSKLPTARQLQWAEKCISLGRTPTVIDFSMWLNCLRRVVNVVTDSLPTNSSGIKRHHPTSNLNSRKFMNVAIEKMCILCDGECTFLDVCKEFLTLTVNGRWSVVKRNK